MTGAATFARDSLSPDPLAGTWEAREWNTHAKTTVVRVINGRFEVVCECTGNGQHSTREGEPRARLIAAAPDFAAAAETMLGSAVDCGSYFKVDADDIAAFRAALAKARSAA